MSKREEVIGVTTPLHRECIRRADRTAPISAGLLFGNHLDRGVLRQTDWIRWGNSPHRVRPGHRPQIAGSGFSLIHQQLRNGNRDGTVVAETDNE